MRRTRPTCLSALTINTPGPILLLTGMLLVATGCTSTHQVTRQSDGYSRLTGELMGETVRVVLHDGRTMRPQNLYVGADSTNGVLPQGGSKRVPTSALRKIEVVDHETGAWQGAGIGLGSGLGTTLLLAGTQESDFGHALALVGGLLVSVPLSLVGGIIGGVRGQRDVDRFPERSPKKSVMTAPSGRRTETVRRQEE